MSTPYSEYYRKKMQEKFSSNESSELRKLNSFENSDREKASKALPRSEFFEARAVKPLNKKDIFLAFGLALLVVAFIVALIALILFLPKGPDLYIITGFIVISIFLFLLFFYKTYEKLIVKINPIVLMIIVYMLLLVNIYLSNRFYSVEWAFLGFVIGAIVFYDARIDSRFLILPALLLLGYVPFLLIAKQNALAETIAIYVYYFLVVGVGLQLVEYVTKTSNYLDFESAMARFFRKDWGRVTIIVGLIAIGFTVLNRFREVEIWKYSFIYLFVVSLVFYFISAIKPERD
jgi:hypothetical protein